LKSEPVVRLPNVEDVPGPVSPIPLGKSSQLYLVYAVQARDLIISPSHVSYVIINMPWLSSEDSISDFVTPNPLQ